MKPKVLSAKSVIDLHLHTTYSDGVWTPEQLVDYLVQEQFGLAAIADYERADTASALLELAEQKQLPLLTAVEVTTRWQDTMVDVLCYGFDPAPGMLNEVVQEIAQRQTENTRDAYRNMRRQGFLAAPQPEGGKAEVGEARYFTELRRLLETPSAQQPHELVTLILQAGYPEDAIGQILTDVGWLWEVGETAEVVGAAHHSGAVCLIAHPGRGDDLADLRLLNQLCTEVPFDGLEVYHSSHTPEQIGLYLDYARQRQMLIGAGSGSRGPTEPPGKYPATLCRGLLERLGVQFV